MPLAGFIWGLVYLVSSHAARKRWGAWALGISLVVGVGDLLLIGGALSHGGIPRIGAGGEAAKTECQQNLKNLAVAVVMFSVDHGDRLPDSARWQEQVRPYFRSEALRGCPSGGTYAMNPQLSGRSMPEIYRMGNPAQIVLFYEVDERGNPLRDVHDGGANYAYVAGNVSWRQASQWRWIGGSTVSVDRLGAGRAYVRKLRQHGRSDAEIRERLEAAGWPERDVLALLGSARLPSAATDADAAVPEALVASWRPYVERLRGRGWSDERIRERLAGSAMSEAELEALLHPAPAAVDGPPRLGVVAQQSSRLEAQDFPRRTAGAPAQGNLALGVAVLLVALLGFASLWSEQLALWVLGGGAAGLVAAGLPARFGIGTRSGLLALWGCETVILGWFLAALAGTGPAELAEGLLTLLGIVGLGLAIGFALMLVCSVVKSDPARKLVDPHQQLRQRLQLLGPHQPTHRHRRLPERQHRVRGLLPWGRRRCHLQRPGGLQQRWHHPLRFQRAHHRELDPRQLTLWDQREPLPGLVLPWRESRP